jgi:hypothetical protein
MTMIIDGTSGLTFNDASAQASAGLLTQDEVKALVG